MPHFHIEYSANLDGRVDMQALCEIVHAAVVSLGPYPLGGLRVRAFRTETYAVADMLPENAFIDMSFRIGAGRSDEDKKRTGEVIFKAVADHLSELFASPHFMLSLEIREIDPDLSWKKNSIHARLNAKG
jgi:5-carboxymethyl-2-hydroxymuconate isomerase